MAYRLDAVWIARVITEFAPQTRDGDIHAAILSIVFDPAQQLEQVLATDHLPGETGQLPQQIEVRRG